MTPQRLCFARSRGGTVLLTSAAMTVFHEHRQIGRLARERGGVMLGRLMAGCDDVIVDSVTEPNRFDCGGRFFFRRARRPAQQAIDSAWEKSRGTRNYIDEWHTHPEKCPEPSSHDLKEWRRLSLEAVVEQNVLFFLIVGQCSVVLWEVSAEHGVVEKCAFRSEREVWL